MQFGNYRDGFWESNIRLLTGTIKLTDANLSSHQFARSLKSSSGRLDLFVKSLSLSWQENTSQVPSPQVGSVRVAIVSQDCPIWF